MPYSGGTGGGAAGSIVVGNPVTGGTNSTVLYIDSSGNLASNSGFTFDGTTLESSKQTNISGPDATTNVEIGSTANDANAGTGGTSVVIGNSANNANFANVVLIGSGATSSGAGAVMIGQGATTSGSNPDAVGIGRANNTKGASGCVAIGLSATVTNSLGVAVGVSASAAGSAIALGTSTAGVAGDFVAGGTSMPITSVWFGKGKTDTTAVSYTINGTGGSGSDNAGGGINLAAGVGTGTAAGGDLRLQTSPSIATGSTAQTLSDCYLIRAQKKTLTESTATPFVRVNIASGVAAVTGWTGGTIFYTIVANDGTDFQSRSGSVNFAIVNKAGTETCVLGTVSSEAAALSAGTLSVTFDSDTSPTNAVDIRANAVSSLTQTTLAMFYSVIMNGPGTLTPQ